MPPPQSRVRKSFHGFGPLTNNEFPLLGKPQRRACMCPGRVLCPVLRRRVRFKRHEQLAGNCCNLVNRGKECSFVGFRWLVEAAHFPHELEGGRTNLCVRHWRFEVEEGLDISTHKRYLIQHSWTARAPTRRHHLDVGNRGEMTMEEAMSIAPYIHSFLQCR